MNIFKKLRFLKEYKKTIHQYKEVLEKEYDIKIDWIDRCYTVLTFDKETMDNIKVYGYSYLDNEVRKYLVKTQKFFNEIGLLELIGSSKRDQLDEYNVLLVFEYRYLNTKKLLISKIIAGILSIIGLIIGLIILI